MNIVMSMWTKPCIDNKKHGYGSVEDMINSLIVSVNVAKKHYNEIHFYTDKIGYEWITPHLHLLPFTKIDVCLNEIDWLDDNYWSLSKLYVYQKQTEPFIHIDNDVFLWDRFPDVLMEKDFFFQEVENFYGVHFEFYKHGLRLYSKSIPKEIEVLGAAFNCGVFACITPKAVNLMKKYYEYGYQFVKNTNQIVTLSVEPESQRWLGTVIIEQVFIYSLVVGNPEFTWDVFLTQFDGGKWAPKMIYNFRYSHMVAHNKRNPIITNKIKERVFLKDWN